MRFDSTELSSAAIVRQSQRVLGFFTRRLHSRTVLPVMLFLLLARLASAQVSATLSGTITDQSGAALSAATVTARNVDTGVARTTNSDAEGRYQLFSLSLGQYEVRGNKQGFAEKVRTGVHLVVGQEAKIDLTLRVGQVTEEVRVNGDAPRLSRQPATSQVSSASKR
jgi:hypothetical protein